VRTNIMIDDTVMQKAMMISGLKTKKEVVERALNEFVSFHSRKDLSELKGTIRFADGYDYKSLREGRR
jgi:Arc/MetJ family transcription regulator